MVKMVTRRTLAHRPGNPEGEKGFGVVQHIPAASVRPGVFPLLVQSPQL